METSAAVPSPHVGRGVGPGLRAAKRLLDLLVGIPALVMAMPVIAALATAVRLETSGSPIFRQLRVGRDGELIEVWKLRTMRTDAEAFLAADPALMARYVRNGFKLEAGRDPRVTRVGRFLRRTSLDELPQLLNVVDGTMSLVGPRPVLPDELEVLYGDDAAVYTLVKPGITGPWQVNGRCHLVGVQRAELDVAYVRSLSVRTDLRLLVRTIPAALSQHGAH
jgi:exopolysaccharide production protein ExoY